MVSIGETYITKNRLIDLISKIGPMNYIKQYGEFIKEYQMDWREDFKKEYGDELSKFDKKDLKIIYKYSSKEIPNIIKEYLENS